MNLITKLIIEIYLHFYLLLGHRMCVQQQRRDIKRRISTIEQPGQKLARMNDSPTGITKNV